MLVVVVGDSMFASCTQVVKVVCVLCDLIKGPCSWDMGNPGVVLSLGLQASSYVWIVSR